MKRETIKKILEQRELSSEKDVFAVTDGEVATVLIGQGQATAIGGIVSIELATGYLVAKSKKGTETYVEYGSVQSLSFESKEVADRHAGFV